MRTAGRTRFARAEAGGSRSVFVQAVTEKYRVGRGHLFDRWFFVRDGRLKTISAARSRPWKASAFKQGACRMFERAWAFNAFIRGAGRAPRSREFRVLITARRRGCWTRHSQYGEESWSALRLSRKERGARGKKQPAVFTPARRMCCRPSNWGVAAGCPRRDGASRPGPTRSGQSALHASHAEPIRHGAQT